MALTQLVCYLLAHRLLMLAHPVVGSTPTSVFIVIFVDPCFECLAYCTHPLTHPPRTHPLTHPNMHINALQHVPTVTDARSGGLSAAVFATL